MILTRPYTIEEIKANLVDGRITGDVLVPVNEMVNLDLENILDRLSELLTGSPLLMGIDYRLIGSYDDCQILRVSGDPSEILRTEDNIESEGPKVLIKTCDHETHKEKLWGFESIPQILKAWWDDDDNTDIPKPEDEVLKLIINGTPIWIPLCGDFSEAVQQLETMYWTQSTQSKNIILTNRDGFTAALLSVKNYDESFGNKYYNILDDWHKTTEEFGKYVLARLKHAGYDVTELESLELPTYL